VRSRQLGAMRVHGMYNYPIFILRNYSMLFNCTLFCNRVAGIELLALRWATAWYCLSKRSICFLHRFGINCALRACHLRRAISQSSKCPPGDRFFDRLLVERTQWHSTEFFFGRQICSQSNSDIINYAAICKIARSDGTTVGLTLNLMVFRCPNICM